MIGKADKGSAMMERADRNVMMVGKVSSNASRAHMIWRLEPPKLTMRFVATLC